MSVTTSFSGLRAQTALHHLEIRTTMGDIQIMLYSETPFHAENFIKLTQDGYYDGVLFHRIIKDFMIQTGDPDSKNAQKGAKLGRGGPSYTVPAEFHPDLYHKKGALAAARQGDDINPQKASSGSQFYIVHGKTLTDAQLDQLEQSGGHIKFTEEQRQVYKTQGGTPHLDYSYTVFGEVTQGLDILSLIQAVETDSYDRPLEDVKILKVKVLK